MQVKIPQRIAQGLIHKNKEPFLDKENGPPVCQPRIAAILNQHIEVRAGLPQKEAGRIDRIYVVERERLVHPGCLNQARPGSSPL